MDRTRLIMAITEQDIKAKGKRGYNPYAMGIMFGAADDCMEMIGEGMAPEYAFTRCFTPTRENHRMAKQLGLPLDVQRGQWVRLEAAII